MAITRTETAALVGVALLHLALFAWLSLAMPEPVPERPPMAVEIIAEPAAVSTAPQISSQDPAPALGTPDVEPEPQPPPPEPEPLPPPPRPAPPPPAPKLDQTREREAANERRRVERERVERERQQRTERERQQRTERERQARAERERQARLAREQREREARNQRGGDPLGDIANNVRNTQGRNPNPPAQQTAAQIRASIEVSINAEVRGPWNGCRVTGVDVDRLRTAVVFRLAQSGALERIVSVTTTGVNDSNRPQVQRFEECARRAITLAAPFNLPSENYQYWQTYTLDFEKR